MWLWLSRSAERVFEALSEKTSWLDHLFICSFIHSLIQPKLSVHSGLDTMLSLMDTNVSKKTTLS